MGGGSARSNPDEPGLLTDPWAGVARTGSPARWWRPPAAVLLGAAGVVGAAGSARQAVVVAALAAVVAALSFAGPRPKLAGAAIRLGVLAVACLAARPHIGGRQLVVTVIAVALSSATLGAWNDRRDGDDRTDGSSPDVNALAIAPLVAVQVVALRDGPAVLTIGLLAVAALLWALGQVEPTALERVDHAVARGVRALVSVVGAVVLFPVVLLCLYLPGLLVRLAATIRSASAAGEPSPWQPYGVGLDDEQTDAVRPFASTPRPLRVRRHLTGAALVAVVALLAGIVIVRARRSEEPPTQGLTATRPIDVTTTAPATKGGAPAKAPFAAELAAKYSSLPPYRDVPWADELQREEGNDPEIRGRWVNVHDSVRASLPPPRCACKKLKVWFAGGSAAFGYGQRDHHTIASDLVRIGAAQGISIDIENIGRAGSTLFVEIQQIKDRLAKEKAPDLIIFMDGFNDGMFLTAFAFGEGHGTDARARSDGLGALEYITAHPDQYLTSNVGPAAGREAATGYGVLRSQMDDLARSRGIATAWFFQPDAFVSPLQLQGYQSVSHISPTEFMRSPLAEALAIMARTLAPEGVTDLRPLFARYPRPVFLGLVHQSEEGAAITAQAIYDDLADRLQRLAS